MKQILSLLIIAMPFFCGGQNLAKTKYDLAYQNGSEICVLSFGDKKELRFDNVYDPALSPDGLKLAYTKSIQDKRWIVVVDLNTKVETKLNVNNNNYYGASWSPDNKYIAFNIFMSPSKWQIAIIKSDNSETKIFNTNSGLGVYQPTWSPDSKNIFAHNESIYKYDLSGKLLDSISIREIFGSYYFSSNSKFLYTSDNRHIIFNCGINEFMKGVDGPVEVIFSYDTETKNIKKLSPQKMYATDPQIESDSTIIFAGSKEGERSNIYRFNFLNNHLELIIKNGKRPTASYK
jgi:Tol biopolymer transport system component